MNEWSTIMTFSFPQQLDVIKSALESEGFETQTRDTQVANMGYGAAVGGAKLLVRNDMYNDAVVFLQEAGYLDLGNELKDDNVYLLPICEDKGYCPFCQSSNFEKLKYNNPLMTLVVFFLAIFVSLYRNNFSCNDCGKKWKYIKG